MAWYAPLSDRVSPSRELRLTPTESLNALLDITIRPSTRFPLYVLRCTFVIFLRKNNTLLVSFLIPLSMVFDFSISSYK